MFLAFFFLFLSKNIESKSKHASQEAFKIPSDPSTFTVGSPDLSIPVEAKSFNFMDSSIITSGTIQYNEDHILGQTNSEINMSFRGTQFWLVGLAGENFGNAAIYLDNYNVANVSFYRPVEKTSCIFYTSPINTPFGDHILMIKGLNQAFSFQQIYFVQDDSILDELIAIPPNHASITYTNGIAGHPGWTRAFDQGAGEGSYTFQQDSFVSCTFYGSRVYYVGNYKNDKGEMEIHIDGRYVKTVNAYHDSADSIYHQILFESEELGYGQHTIKVINRNKVNRNNRDGYPMHFRCFLIRPFPKHSGVVANPPNLTQSEEYEYTFTGTRFWLNGLMDETVGNITVDIDGQHQGTFSRRIPTPTPPYLSLEKALMYESPDLDFGEHTVHIRATAGSIVLSKCFYSTQPKNGVIIPPYELTNIDNLDSNGLYPIQASTKVEFPMYGTHFYLFGLNDNSNVNIVYQYNENEITNNLQTSSEGLQQSNLFVSNKFALDSYNINFQTTDSITLSYIYYLNTDIEKKEPCYSYSQLDYDSSQWESLINSAEGTANEGINTVQVGATLTIHYYGRNYWLEGTMGPNFGNVKITLDKQEPVIVSMYREEHSNFTIFYKSPENIELNYHTVVLENVKGEINFNKIYYLNPNDHSISFRDSSIKTSGTTESQDSLVGQTNSVINMTFRGTQFWLVGLVGPDYGDAAIYLDNYHVADVSFNRQEPETNCVFYTSPINTPFGDHILMIKGINGKFSFQQIYFVQDDSILDELIAIPPNHGNITYTNTDGEYSHWGVMFRDDANEGSFTFQQNASVSCTFYGSRVYYVGNYKTDKGEMEIHIDGRYVKTVNAYHYSADSIYHQILFESEELGYGQHTIKVINRNKVNRFINKYDGYPMHLRCFLIRPFPKYSGVVTDAPNLTQSSTEYEYTFTGTRFWLNGLMDQNNRDVTISIDQNQHQETFSPKFDKVGDNYKSLEKALLYESPYLDFGQHTVHISVTTGSIVLSKCFYSTQPKNGVIIPPNELTNIDNLDSNGLYPIEALEQVAFPMYGTQFYLFGLNEKSGVEIVYKYNENEINSRLNSTSEELHQSNLFISEKIDPNSYQITFHTAEPITLSYIYYLNADFEKIEQIEHFYSYSQLDYDSSQWESLINSAEGTANEGINTAQVGATLTIHYIGRNFWLEGTMGPNFGNVKITLDKQEPVIVSMYREEHSNFTIFYKSPENIELNYHTVVLENVKGEINFNKIYYWGPPSQSISCSDLSSTETTGTELRDDSLIGQLNSQINMSFLGTQFWLVGLVGPEYGDAAIYLDNYHLANVSFYRQEPETNCVFYTSPINTPFGDHILMIKGINESFSFHKIYFVQDTSIYNELIEIPPNHPNITYTDGDTTGNYQNWHISFVDSEAGEGSYTFQQNAFLSYTFYGSRIYYVGNYRYDKGEMEIHIDGRHVKTVNAYHVSRDSIRDKILFESEELGYGQHTIKVINRNTFNRYTTKQDGYSMHFRNFMIRPFPKHSGGVAPFTKDSTECTFTCTRFWIYSLMSTSVGDATVYIDGESKGTFSRQIPDLEVDYNSLNKALVYESPDLDFGQHTVRIHVTAGEVPLGCLYSTQPKNGVIIPPYELTNIDNLDSNGLYPLGSLVPLTFPMYGTQFYLFGLNEKSDAKIVYKYNENVINTNLKTSSEGLQQSNIFISTQLELDSYSITFHTDANIHLSYIYYLNDDIEKIGGQEQHSYSYSQLEYDSSQWESLINSAESTANEGINTVQVGATLTIRYYGYHYWLEGTMGPNFGKVKITLDNQEPATVSMYREEHSPFTIFYKSPKVSDLTYHTVVLENVKGEINFNKFYYWGPTAQFTESISFTPSSDFSSSTDFTQSVSFTESLLFSESNEFSQSADFTNSEGFSDSSHFHGTQEFSKSLSFSASSQFSSSTQFTVSDHFSISDQFSISSSFSSSAEPIKVPDGSGGGNASPNNTTLIIGVVIGVIVLIAIIAVILVLFIRKKRQASGDQDSIPQSEALSINNLYSNTLEDQLDHVEMNSEVMDIFGSLHENFE